MSTELRLKLSNILMTSRRIDLKSESLLIYAEFGQIKKCAGRLGHTTFSNYTKCF